MSAPYTALVTGGASGIGAAVSTKLASRGVYVLIVDLNASAGEALARELSEKYAVQCKYLGADITSEEDVKRMVAEVVNSWGRLDYAANCAGICENIWAEEESITTELVDRTFAVNQRGLWLCQKHEALQMKSQEARDVVLEPPSRFPIKAQRGQIVNIGSTAALNAQGLAAYTPTKHAVLGITKNGAKFYGPHGIRCNAVCPGYTMTPMLEESMGREGTPGTKENEGSAAAATVTLGRMGFAQEQANVVSFLLGKESSYVNGAYIVCDGGWNDIR